MPKKNTLKKTAIEFTKPLANKQEGFLSQIKWGESYTSLFLGAVVVLVALVLVFSFLKSRNLQNGETGSASDTESTEQNLPKSYTVKNGDNLWSVAENLYGSGYNWVDLAKENKLVNPGILYVGTKLSVPNVERKELTVEKDQVQKNPITGTTYTVVRGDYLWNIALRAYGDGYKWVEIAKANKLINPNIIHPGNIFKLPR